MGCWRNFGLWYWPWVVAGFAYYVIRRNDTINDSIFHRSNGMQGAYSKMLCVVRILFLVCWVRDLNPQTLSCDQVPTHLTTALHTMMYLGNFFFLVSGCSAASRSREQMDTLSGSTLPPGIRRFRFRWNLVIINICIIHFLNWLITVYPRSSDPFYVVTYYINWVTTSLTYSIYKKKINFIGIHCKSKI